MIKSKTSRSAKIGKAPFLVLPLLLFIAQIAFAAIDVTATVDRNELGPEDTLTYTLSVSTADEVEFERPQIPAFSDFETLNQWTSQEARASFVNTPTGPQFQTVRSVKMNFSLQPKKQGTLRIPSVEMTIAGKKYATKQISVKVAPGLGSRSRGQGGRGGGIQLPPGFEEDEDDVFSQLLRRQMPGLGGGGNGGERTLPINPQDAFFIQVDVDKTDVYVGEQVTASWYLYTRGQIRDLDTLKYPSLKGFWKEDIELATQLSFTSEVVNGIPYKKALLASFALFPIKEGPATIDPYQAKCSVVPMVDSFGGAFSKAYTFTKSSQPIKINVKPLPADGRPADFTGAVGTYEISARVEDRNIVENQPFTLKVRFEGQGNAKLIEQPPFQPPEGLEIYDSQNDSKFFRTGTSFKEFNILLIPRRSGEFTIPALTTSIFDTKAGRYVTKATQPIRVIVGKGQAGGQTQSLGLETSIAKKPQGPQEPKLITDWRNESVASRGANAVGFVALFAFVIATLLWRARRELGWGQRKKDLQRMLKARIRRVDERVSKGDWRGVGSEMTNAAYFVLGEISGEGGANEELSKLLLKAPPSVRRELAEPLSKQIETFQILSFAPENVVGSLKEPTTLKASVSEMAKLLERAVQLGAEHVPTETGR